MIRKGGKVNQKRMLPKPWHFLFPFNSERFIKLSAVPRHCTPLYLPVADLLARPALPFAPQRGRGRAGAGAGGRCGRYRGAGFSPRQPPPKPRPPLPAQPGVFSRTEDLRSATRGSAPWPTRGPALPREEFRVKGIDRAPRPPPSCKMKVNPAAPRSPPRGRSRPEPGRSPALADGQRAGRAGGATYLGQPAAPPGAEPRRRPRHLHGDIRSTAGTLSGAGARRRPACCGALRGGRELCLRRSRGPT